MTTTYQAVLTDTLCSNSIQNVLDDVNWLRNHLATDSAQYVGTYADRAELDTAHKVLTSLLRKIKKK